MGLFSSFFDKSKKQPLPNNVRDCLFGDMPLHEWPRVESVSNIFPWNLFISVRSHLATGNQDEALKCWHRIVEHDGLESLHYLQAWCFLRQHGQQPSTEAASQVLGVVVEIGMPKGLDIIAAYKDGNARYYNHSGAALIWPHPDTSLDQIINAFFEVADQIKKHLPVWNQARLPAPLQDQARISFLTPGGLNFGQGSFEKLSQDKFGGPMLKLASSLMRALIAKKNSAREKA